MDEEVARLHPEKPGGKLTELTPGRRTISVYRLKVPTSRIFIGTRTPIGSYLLFVIGK
jgi:hypothetical protein